MARAPWRLWVGGSDHPNMQDISGWPPKKDKIKNQESDVYIGHTRKAENVMMDGRFKGLFKDLAETVSMRSARAFCGVATSCGDFIHCTCWKTLVRNRPTDFQLITFSTDRIYWLNPHLHHLQKINTVMSRVSVRSARQARQRSRHIALEDMGRQFLYPIAITTKVNTPIN